MESQDAKTLRIAKAATKKPRAVSGWNMFQQHSLKGQSHSTQEYKNAVKLASAAWRNMSFEEQSEWNTAAARANLDREAVAATPLPVSGEGLSELEMKVGKKALSKISTKRLSLNEMQFQEHPIWSAPSQLGDGPSGAIRFLKLSCVIVAV